MGARLVKWLLFTVLFALVPFGLTALILWNRGKDPSFSILWSDGELSLVSSAIAADALADVIGAGKTLRTIKLSLGGICLLLLFMSAAWYATVRTFPGFDPDKVWKTCLILFGMTLVVAFPCKMIME